METSDENQVNKIVFSDEVQRAIEQVFFNTEIEIGVVGCDIKKKYFTGTPKY